MRKTCLNHSCSVREQEKAGTRSCQRIESKADTKRGERRTASLQVLRYHCYDCELLPKLKSLNHFLSVSGSKETQPSRPEMLGDGSIGSKELLGMSGELNPSHAVLSLAGGRVGVFCAYERTSWPPACPVGAAPRYPAHFLLIDCSPQIWNKDNRWIRSTNLGEASTQGNEEFKGRSSPDVIRDLSLVHRRVRNERLARGQGIDGRVELTQGVQAERNAWID
jgi:hypothetical protein